MKRLLAKVVVYSIGALAVALVATMFVVALVTVWQFSKLAVILPAGAIAACLLWVWGMTTLLEGDDDSR